MYLPKHFEESNINVLHQMMRAHPLATLVTMSSQGINANHIPLYLAEDSEGFGVLQGHVARANPVWSDFNAEVEALAIFQGPDSYISPSWYPTKQEDGKVVPTWNYVVVHAYGSLNIIDDPIWLRKQLEALTNKQEATFNKPWAVADAPPEYIEKMANAIVGIEIKITKLSGKWKVSQNQPKNNQIGAADGLKQLGDNDAEEMASLIMNRTQMAE